METLEAWLRDHGITEVECFVPDMAGIARGKVMPAAKFVDREGLRLPESVFIQTVTGDYADDEGLSAAIEPDVVLRPDPTTIRLVPWASDPTAQVINDAHYADGQPVDIASRYVLRRVLEAYAERGWSPIVAPELEFYLVKVNTDPDYPLEPPVGRCGRAETVRQSYGIDAVNEFDPVFEDMYDFAEAQHLDIDTLIHEGGAAQMEINFVHGEPLDLADQVLLFKRTVREVALRHKIYATFMAKPMASEPGSSMHIHQSILDVATGANIFADENGTNTQLFMSFIAGLQTYLPSAMAIFAPYVNSYRRIARYHSAPINTQWGFDNRTVGLRVPFSSATARRVENRVAGADVNPYLAIAASLACGYLGMVQGLTPGEPESGDAYKLPYSLPRNLESALENLRVCEPLRAVLGAKFVDVFCAIKQRELENFFNVVSPWEREYLLLNV
ncbi:MAG: glutamine synthetase [Gammaproteobacteria bacterium]|nr:glutamine synthetase [Gammaproteobacteria bacterium]